MDLIKEIKKNDRNQPKSSYVYNSDFLRLINKFVLVNNCYFLIQSLIIFRIALQVSGCVQENNFY